MDEGRTAAAAKYGRDRGGSGIITRWGRRVAFWGDQRKKYDLKSSTKSFGSIMAALAFKDRRINRESLVQPILPELGLPQNTSQKKAWLAEIRVNHLLTHTAGFGKVGGVTNLEFRPGSAWRYSDGGTNWLADLLTVPTRPGPRTCGASGAGCGDARVGGREVAWRVADTPEQPIEPHAGMAGWLRGLLMGKDG